jgi:hypothetical protein
LVNLKTKSAGDGYPKKAIEKTVLRFLGARTFSHGLDPFRTLIPRSDLTVNVNNVAIEPALSLMGWAGVIKSGSTAVTYGDLYCSKTNSIL